MVLRVRVLVLVLVLAGGARADDLQDAAPLIKSLEASRAVLLLRADVVSPGCVDALREMKSMQDQLELDGKTKDHEIPIVRDVLATDYDTAARTCGSDAAVACLGRPAGKLAAACAARLPVPP